MERLGHPFESGTGGGFRRKLRRTIGQFQLDPGKSVTVKLMIGLLRTDRGKLIVNGRDVTELHERDWIAVRADFGMVFQGAALFDSLNVLDNVGYPLREHTDLSDAEIQNS